MSKIFAISILVLFSASVAFAESPADGSKTAQAEKTAPKTKKKKRCPVDAKKFRLSGMFTKKIDPKEREDENKRRDALLEKSFELIKDPSTRAESELLREEALGPEPYDPTFKLLPWIFQQRDKLLSSHDFDCPPGVALFVDSKPNKLIRSFGKIYRLPFEEEMAVCCENLTTESVVVIKEESAFDFEYPEEPLKTPKELKVTVEEPLVLELLH